MDNFNHTISQPFYNTIQLTEDQWKGENDKALALQKVVSNVFETNYSTKISGWQMKFFLESKLKKKVNINSVRRAISNLKNENEIIKTAEMRMGEEGKNEHYYMWRIGNEDKGIEKIAQGTTLAEFAEKMQPQKLEQVKLFNGE